MQFHAGVFETCLFFYTPVLTSSLDCVWYDVIRCLVLTAVAGLVVTESFVLYSCIFYPILLFQRALPYSCIRSRASYVRLILLHISTEPDIKSLLWQLDGRCGLVSNRKDREHFMLSRPDTYYRLVSIKKDGTRGSHFCSSSLDFPW